MFPLTSEHVDLSLVLPELESVVVNSRIEWINILAG